MRIGEFLKVGKADQDVAERHLSEAAGREFREERAPVGGVGAERVEDFGALRLRRAQSSRRAVGLRREVGRGRGGIVSHGLSLPSKFPNVPGFRCDISLDVGGVGDTEGRAADVGVAGCRIGILAADAQLSAGALDVTGDRQLAVEVLAGLAGLFGDLPERRRDGFGSSFGLHVVRLRTA